MNLTEVSSTQRFKEVTINENFESIDFASVYGKRLPASVALTWAYWGGRWGGFAVSAGTLTLSNNADNYIVVLRSTGAISVSTSATNWNNTTDYARVYKVTTAGSLVTAVEDHRAGPGGVQGPSAVSVSGPSSATDNAIARYDGATGKLLQNSVVTISDTGAIAGVTTLSVSGQITSTLVTGTAPLSITSTTVVPNLNVSQLLGATWAAPGAIGSGTPSTGAFTTVTVTTLNGLSITASTGTLTVDNGKIARFANTLTFTGTDGATIGVGTGAAMNAIGSMTPAADRLPYFTSGTTGTVTTYTAGARALDGLTYAADKIGYTTSASAAATTDLTSVARTLIAQTTQAALRSTGLGIDTLTQPLMNYGGYQLDGSTDYLDGNAISGIADSKVGTLVLFIRFANAASVTEDIFTSTGSAIRLIRSASGTLTLSAENAAGTTILSQSRASVLASAGTYCIMLSWDMAAGSSSMRMYVNDVTGSITNTTFTDDTIDYTVAEYSLGANVSGSNKVTGDLYYAWFDPTSAQDFSSAAVRRKFIDANSVPQFLGSHGEYPTGTPPLVFLAYSEFQNWPRNRGLSTSPWVENGTPGAVGTVLYGQAAAVDTLARTAHRTTAVGNVGAGEDNLITYVLPANRMITRDMRAHVKAWGTTANNANAKTLKLYFGSAVILTNALTISVAGRWIIEAEVISTGTDTQDYVAELRETGTGNADIEIGTATEDDGAAITIKCTGDATADNDIVQEGLIVTLVGA